MGFPMMSRVMCGSGSGVRRHVGSRVEAWLFGLPRPFHWSSLVPQGCRGDLSIISSSFSSLVTKPVKYPIIRDRIPSFKSLVLSQDPSSLESSGTLTSVTKNLISVRNFSSVTPSSTSCDPKVKVPNLNESSEMSQVSVLKSYPFIITPGVLSEFKTEFSKNEANKLALNICSRNDPLEVCLTRSGLEDVSHVFTHRVESEGKPVTNQKQSGRCWIFAFLNAARIPFMKQMNLEEFEFSPSYLFFYDKLEKCNHFMNSVVEAFKRGEPVEGRLMSFLLHDPVCDGGQWDMLINLVSRYGVLPKSCFPETFSSESSGRVNAILKSKLREYCKILRSILENQPNSVDGEEGYNQEVTKVIKEKMGEIHRILCICLGIPKETFVWEYYDKTKAYHKIGPITPLEFYDQFVRPVFDAQKKVCLVNDPRPNNPYGKLYTVDYLGNVVGARKTNYNNQKIELLMKCASDSLIKGEPVWFGCEVLKRFAAKQGIEDFCIHDYKSVFGLDVGLGLSKADRLKFGESCMTHAMIFTGCSIEQPGDQVTKWRVENSWGDDRGDKGYIVMTSEWFKEFVFEVVVDQSYVPQHVLDVFQQEAIILPAWDPMGTLAKS